MMESFACYVYCSACRPRGLQGFQELDLDDAELAPGVAAFLGLEEVELAGGEFTAVALAWLQWQLKGDKKAAKMFVGNDCDLSKRKDWTIEKNAKFSTLK